MGRFSSTLPRARSLARHARDSLNRTAVRAARTAHLGHYIVLEYPTSSARPRTRAHGSLYELLTAGEPQYRQALRTLASYEDDLARISRQPQGAGRPAWENDFLPGLDAAAIYGFLRSREPQTYLEVGSGSSTRFARRAIEDGNLPTRIVSIDPSPRAEIDALCDEVIRRPFELADPSAMARLRAGDIVFLDGSHRVFTGSDVSVFVLDVLPTLAPGVLIGVHDVYLPDDYPQEIVDRHYSEQYLLAALLLGQPSWLRLVLAADYVSKRPELSNMLRVLWSRPELRGIKTHGVALWCEVCEPRA